MQIRQAKCDNVLRLMRLDRKVSRDKNNFHYAWEASHTETVFFLHLCLTNLEDLRKYHFVEYIAQAQRDFLQHLPVLVTALSFGVFIRTRDM